MPEGPTPEDALQVAQRALSKVNGLERELHATQEDLDEVAEDYTALVLRVQERDETTRYSELTLDDKIGMVREHAFRKAADGHGRAKLDYDDIRWEVFDGNPGTDHCYKLMRLAAGHDEDDRKEIDADVQGFAFRNPDDDVQHLAVDAEKAKRGVAFSSENKTASGEVR